LHYVKQQYGVCEISARSSSFDYDNYWICKSVEALCWTDPPAKESYQMSVDREVH
jgi:hypothetical protein